MAPLLRVENLETEFRGRDATVAAVRSVSFDLDRGETLALVGESGSGKTATALSIVQLLPPAGQIAAGRVLLDGEDLRKASASELRRVRGGRIATVFQDSMTSLNPLLTVGRQITESLHAHLGATRRDADRRAVALLDEVGVPDARQRLRQYPHQLSGGLRQRVAIAVAIACNPDVLIADEPTTALDVTIQAQILDLLRREQEKRNMALLLITHDLGVVAAIADRVCVMYAGKIVERGTLHALYTDPRHPYTIGLLRSVPRLESPLVEELPSIPGAPPVAGELPPGCPFHPRCPSAFERCTVEDPQLLPAGDGREAACWLTVSGGTA